MKGDIEDLSLTFSVSETAMGALKEVDLIHRGSKVAVRMFLILMFLILMFFILMFFILMSFILMITTLFLIQ